MASRLLSFTNRRRAPEGGEVCAGAGRFRGLIDSNSRLDGNTVDTESLRCISTLSSLRIAGSREREGKRGRKYYIEVDRSETAQAAVSKIISTYSAVSPFAKWPNRPFAASALSENISGIWNDA